MCNFFSRCFGGKRLVCKYLIMNHCRGYLYIKTAIYCADERNLQVTKTVYMNLWHTTTALNEWEPDKSSTSNKKWLLL